MQLKCVAAVSLALVATACDPPFTPTPVVTESIGPTVPIGGAIRMSIGETVDSAIGPGDLVELDQFLDEYRFRQVYFVAREPVRAWLKLVMHDGAQAYWLSRNANCCEWLSVVGNAAVVDIPAGTELVMEIRSNADDVTRRFTVSAERYQP